MNASGAGGEWPRNDERDDVRVAPQAYCDSCGPASGRLTLVLRELTAPSEEDLYDAVGRRPASVEMLATAMNERGDGRAKWRGTALFHDDFGHLLRVLSAYTPWIAHLREPRSPLGHLVVVEEIGDGGLAILDPWEPGTGYRMTEDAFFAHWTLELVLTGYK